MRGDALDISRFMSLLGNGTDWVIRHSESVIGVLVALIILAYLMTGRASK